MKNKILLSFIIKLRSSIETKKKFKTLFFITLFAQYLYVFTCILRSNNFSIFFKSKLMLVTESCGRIFPDLFGFNLC